MDKKIDERFSTFTKGKDINESIDNFKQYWWDKEAKPEMEDGIDKAIQKEEVDKEILEVMRELLKGVKVKKMKSYLEDVIDGKT